MTETTILDDSAVSEIEAQNKIHDLVISPEIDALCATVKHLRQENERLLSLYNSAWLWVQQRVKHPNSGLPPAAMTLMEMLPLLNQRAIQICKDKAAEYERHANAAPIGSLETERWPYLKMRDTANTLAAELEKL